MQIPDTLYILCFLLFGIHLVIYLVVPLQMPFNFKLSTQAQRWSSKISGALTGRNMGHQKEHQKLQNEHHAAWECSGDKKTSATLHGNAFAVCMVQMGPPKKASRKQPKPFFVIVLNVLWIPSKMHRCPTDTYQNERHAAWERVFPSCSKNMSADGSTKNAPNPF